MRSVAKIFMQVSVILALITGALGMGLQSLTVIAKPAAQTSSNLFYVIDGAAQGVGSTLSANAGSGALTDTIPSAAGGNFVGTPTNPLVYTISAVTGTYNASATTQFALYLDSLTAVGNGIQARISYDFTGDGTWDRLETYNYFATDPVTGYELYTQAQGQSAATGTFANLSNGKVKLEVWNAIGTNTDLVRTSATSANGQQSTVTIPYTGGTSATATRTNTPVAGPTATRTNTPLPGTGVIFYQDINYGGTASGAKAIGNYATLPADVPNDWMSSLKVPAGWVVDSYVDANFGGAVCTFTADTSWVGTACNDVMTSFKIHLPLTNTPTPTITPTTVVGACNQPNVPNFGPNVRIFDTTMSAATIQAQLDSDFNMMKDTQTAQFSENRVAHLFKPGSYTVNDNVGFYTSVAGLGLNPGDVTIVGAVTVDAFNASDAGNATQNFWRSAENLTINTSGGADRWAVAQAAPFRRINVLGGLNVFPASFGWASGGYISDVKVSGVAASASQQQFYSKDSNFGGWTGAVWNMVFSGVSGAPAPSFPANPSTVLGTTPVSRDVPYLYFSGGNYFVFAPSLRTNSSGTSWPNTPGTSIPMSQFYVVKAGDTATTINNALSQNCNLFFTPGVYHVNQTINVNRAGTIVLGIGYPTIVNDNGVNAMQVANVDGVRLKGLLFDAGTTNAAAQLTIGTAGNTTGHASNPVTIQDVFFRIGGQFAGKVTTSLIVNSYDTIIDHIWAWRADHGAGIGWTANTADTGLIVNGNNVLATGLFVEHYQKYEVIWNGNNGKIIFFQNEMPYDVPNQASWMNGTTNGYAAIKVANTVTTFEAWGLGSYCFFNVNPAVVSAHAFEAPNVAGVKWHNLSTVSLGNVGMITNVINTTGPQTPTNSTPATVTSYP